jgi:2-succinyl-6-hydroxy-2,4-cyclohexadiene-1-carboxylate synthase
VTARYRLVALHGFLGRASDWDALGEWFPDATITALDLWSLVASRDAVDWPSVGRALDRALVEAAGRYGAEPVFVVGYSFGARLALSSGLLAAPGSPVRGCCFVSCNPGIPEENDGARAERTVSDDTWARRILDWPEPDIWRAWDAQPVFRGSQPFSPREGLPAPRAVLAMALRRLSLGAQPDFRARLEAWPSPVLWITGAHDSKFSALARELASAGVPATFMRCAAAGHRVPWDNPAAFAHAVRTWMAQVMEMSR